MAALIIPSIFTAVDKLSPAIAKMSKSISGFAVRNQKNFENISNAASKVAKTGAIITASLIAPLLLATNAAVGFETKMSNVATLLDTSQENMKVMGDQVLELSKKLPVPIEELTTSLYDIRSSGIAANKAMETLEVSAKLSAAGLATTAESTNILTSAMNAFKADGLTTAQTADYLFKTVKFGKTTLSQLAQAFGATAPIVQSAGATLADFQAMTAALTLSGTPAAQAQNQLKAAMIALMKPTADLDKIFKKLGVKSSQDLIKKSGGVVNAFRKINEIGVKMGTNMAKAWGSTEALAAVTPLLDSASAAGVAYAASLDDMLHGANAVDSAFEKQKSTFKAQSQLMKNNIEAITISIGNELIPILGELLKEAMPFIKRTSEWVKNNKDLVKTIIKITMVAAAFAGVITVLSSVVAVVSKGMALWSIITKGFIIAQTALNIALTANPIGLIIVGIAALIALIVVVIKKYNEWGAALSFLTGPFALIINLVMSFRRNWDLIVAAFKNGGILEGLKMIGATLLDAVLMPLQQIMELIAKFTGADWAKSAVKGMQDIRGALGVNVEGATEQNNGKVINSNTERSESVKNTISQKIEKQNVDVNIKTDQKNTTVKTNNNLAKVSLSSTMGY